MIRFRRVPRTILREVMEHHCLSAREVGEELDLSAHTVRHIMCGNRDFLGKYADALLARWPLPDDDDHCQAA